MFKIEENGLYSRADLAEALAPMGVDVDHFIGRLRPRKVFKMVWLGADLLAAFRAAPSLAEREDAPELPPPANRGNRTRRAGVAEANHPGATLQDYLESLKKDRS